MKITAKRSSSGTTMTMASAVAGCCLEMRDVDSSKTRPPAPLGTIVTFFRDASLEVE